MCLNNPLEKLSGTHVKDQAEEKLTMISWKLGSGSICVLFTANIVVSSLSTEAGEEACVKNGSTSIRAMHA